MTENSLITLYCIIDDFIHRFLETSAGKKNLALYYVKRGSKRRMPIADVVTLNLIRIFDRTGDLKTFHRNASEHYISSLNVMKGLASRGKSTTGWFFGFKLQGICTADGTIIKLCFRPGKEHGTYVHQGTVQAAFATQSD